MTCNELASGNPQKGLANLQKKEFLPTAEVHSAMINDLTFLIPGIIINYLAAYQQFGKSISFHIPHAHAAKITKISEVVCDKLSILH